MTNSVAARWWVGGCLWAAALLIGFPPRVAADPPARSGAKAAVTVQVASWEQVLHHVAAQKGKVVVIDAWSSSCAPCLKEFPKFVALRNRYAASGLHCISFNCDYDSPGYPPEKFREKVLRYLEAQQAESENFIASDLHETWLTQRDLGSLPAVFVFDRRGKLVRRFDSDSLAPGEKEFSYATITPFVEKLLGKKGE